MFTAFQTRTRSNRPARPHAAMVVALVCLALLAMLTVAQVTHTHADNADADHCQLCIVMHSVAPVVAAAVLITLVQLEFASLAPEILPVTRRWHAKLFIRPPPICC